MTIGLEGGGASPTRGRTPSSSSRSVFEPDGDHDDDAWRRLGSSRILFCFRLLHALLERALANGALRGRLRVCRDAHTRASDPVPPRWLIEAVSRATLGEPQLVEGIDPDDLFEVAGFLIRDLVDVLAIA